MPNCHGLGSAAPATAAMHIAPSASARRAHPFSFSHVFNRNMRLLPLIPRGQPGAAFREGLTERTRTPRTARPNYGAATRFGHVGRAKFTPKLAPATTPLTPPHPVATSRRMPRRRRSRLLLPTPSAHIEAVP